MSVFYGTWDAGYHQYHFVGTGGYILVHPALHVRELSLQFVLGSSSHTYFIGYKDEGCVLCREAVEFRLGTLPLLRQVPGRYLNAGRRKSWYTTG